MFEVIGSDPVLCKGSPCVCGGSNVCVSINEQALKQLLVEKKMKAIHINFFYNCGVACFKIFLFYCVRRHQYNFLFKIICSVKRFDLADMIVDGLDVNLLEINDADTIRFLIKWKFVPAGIFYKLLASEDFISLRMLLSNPNFDCYEIYNGMLKIVIIFWRKPHIIKKFVNLFDSSKLKKIFISTIKMVYESCVPPTFVEMMIGSGRINDIDPADLGGTYVFSRMLNNFFTNPIECSRKMAVKHSMTKKNADVLVLISMVGDDFFTVNGQNDVARFFKISYAVAKKCYDVLPIMANRSQGLMGNFISSSDVEFSLKKNEF